MHTQTNGGHSKEGARGRPTCDQPGCEHAACSTGPGGDWCADHLEPHQRKADFLVCTTCNGLFHGSARGLFPPDRCLACRGARPEAD